MSRALRLAYTLSRAKDPLLRRNVVVCHGLLGSKQNWLSIAHALTKNGCGSLYTVDMRNHGESPHSDDMTYPSMASDLIRFIEDMKLSDVCVIGHSMGGKAAICAALMEPEKISQLVVVDSSPFYFPKVEKIWPYIELLENTDLCEAQRKSGGSLVGVRRFLMNEWKNVIPDQMMRLFMLTNLYQSGTDFAWRVNLKAIQAHWEDLMGFPSELRNCTYSNPTMFIVSGRSGIITRSDVPKLQKHFPQVTVLSVIDAGHWVHADAPHIVVNLLTAFIKGSGENLRINGVENLSTPTPNMRVD